MYEIQYANGVTDDLIGLRAYERAKILDTVDAQHDRVVITRQGKPLVLMIGVEGMDTEQLQLGSSDKFWRLITERRKEKTMSRAALEQKLAAARPA